MGAGAVIAKAGLAEPPIDLSPLGAAVGQPEIEIAAAGKILRRNRCRQPGNHRRDQERRYSHLTVSRILAAHFPSETKRSKPSDGRALAM